MGLFLMRLLAGMMMLTLHGWPKLTGFTELANRFPDPIGLGSTVSLSLAVFAEVLCAALVVAGIATRAAAVPLVITMLVAAFIVHAGDPWSKKELAILYAITFTAIMLNGGGAYQLGRQIGGAAARYT